MMQDDPRTTSLVRQTALRARDHFLAARNGPRPRTALAALLPAAAFARNPLLRTASSVNFQVMKDQAVFPSHPTPGVNRGYDPKTLREDGTLARATSTCGAVVYRGDAFPAEYRGNAFVPEPSSNLVKRLKLTEKDGVITAEDAHPGTEPKPSPGSRGCRRQPPRPRGSARSGRSRSAHRRERQLRPRPPGP